MRSIEELPKVDHLILLVGGNPLPNAVAGLTLLNPGGTITLIHSCGVSGTKNSGTKNVAERLKTWFEDANRGIPCAMAPTPEADPTKIFDCTWNSLKGVQKFRKDNGKEEFQSVGLNYTGATKMMSVHAHDALLLWGAKNNRKPVCTYLDARTLRMVVDPIRDAAKPESSPDAMYKYVGDVDISLDDLLKLHKWEKSKWRSAPYMPATAHAIGAANSQELHTGAWIEWRKQILAAYDIATNNEQRKLITITLPTNPSLASLRSGLKGDLTLAEGATATNVQHIIDAAKVPNAVKVEEWFKGEWLESLVLDSVLACQKKFNLHDVGMNFRPTDSSRTDPNKNPELDVVAMRGYQLFIFSCGTGSGGGKYAERKLKLFEVAERARQLGGDEARVAFVCCETNPKDLQNLEEELHSNMDMLGRIKVFGGSTLGNLSDHIGAWMQDQNQEVN